MRALPVLTVLWACTARTPAGRVEIVAAPEGDVASFVHKMAADLPGRALLVYEGAPWCEPCQAFHKAAADGKLDADFPTLTLLEFDNDRDADRLAAAGYQSKLIPLFAVPGPDGRSAGRQIEGGIKGDGAVDEIIPRLKSLVGQPSPLR